METLETVVVTGGNTGLGYACARHLAAAGGRHVVIACRNAEKAAAAVEALKAETGSPHIEARSLELASLASVRRFAEELRTAGLPPLKAIVCNAGIQVVSGTTTTEDGFETTFGVNHLGHFLLVQLLLPQLVAPGRIVFVASGTHDPAQRTGMPVPRYTNGHALARPELIEGDVAAIGRERYTTSKLCNIFCTYELVRRLEAEGRTGLTVNAFDPGLMPGSGLARDYGPLQQFVWNHVMPVLRRFMPNVNSTEDSGAALARLVTDPALATVTGRYFEGRREIRSSEESYRLEPARELWESSLALVGLAPEGRAAV